jgi:hypothetical protein
MLPTFALSTTSGEVISGLHGASRLEPQRFGSHWTDRIGISAAQSGQRLRSGPINAARRSGTFRAMRILKPA